MIHDETNAELIAAALQGGHHGQQAWTEIVRRHSNAVWRALWTCNLTATDREDLFQTAWIRALERLSQVREPDRLHVWLMRIARNEAIALTKKQGRTLPTADVEPEPTPDTVADRVLADERHIAFARALRRVSDECQNLFRLLTVDPPLHYVDIENIMGWPSGGTAIRRQRCIDRIRATPEIVRHQRDPGHGDRP